MKQFLVVSTIFTLLFIISCGPEEDCREATTSKPGYKCNEKSGFWEKLKNGETGEVESQSCTTIDGNMWSSLSSEYMGWNAAVSYCNNLTECGYSDWRLPNINELRTLIKNCSGTVTGGSCGVTDSCLSSSCWNEDSCWSCSYDDSGKYSKLGDTYWFWSSSVLSDNSDNAWNVSFDHGDVSNDYVGNYYYVRCVR